MAGKFIKVKCDKCDHEQVVFERASTTVVCDSCGEVLAEPSGGRAVIRAKELGPAK